MALFGNLLTHYNYQRAGVRCTATPEMLEIQITTDKAEADLHVVAELGLRPAPLPPESPFPDLRTARLFAGPLPYTFDYEPETHSLVLIEGVRTNWNPQPVRVQVLRNSFLEKPPFNEAVPLLANAFHLEDIAYRWKRGVREKLNP
jgi:hypothetical protein